MNETIGTLDDVIITSEATANDIGRDDNASPRTLIRPASDRGAIDLALCLYPTCTEPFWPTEREAGKLRDIDSDSSLFGVSRNGEARANTRVFSLRNK